MRARSDPGPGRSVVHRLESFGRMTGSSDALSGPGRSVVHRLERIDRMTWSSDALYVTPLRRLSGRSAPDHSRWRSC